MSDNDWPTDFPFGYTLDRMLSHTSMLVHPYPGSGKWTYPIDRTSISFEWVRPYPGSHENTAYLRALYMQYIAQRALEGNQKLLTPEVFEAIARAVANQGRPYQVTPFRPHLPIEKPPTIRDSFGQVLSRPGTADETERLSKLTGVGPDALRVCFASMDIRRSKIRTDPAPPPSEAEAKRDARLTNTDAAASRPESTPPK